MKFWVIMFILGKAWIKIFSLQLSVKYQCILGSLALVGKQSSVIYWPSTEPSIKRFTCVNKQKNSGSRWVLENNITRCPGRFESVGDRMPVWEPACRLRALRPSVTHGWATQAKMWKKCCYGWGRTWVNIAVRPCLHSFLTHNKHHLFENKVWEIYIFIKKCICSLLKSSLLVDCFRM